MACRVGLRSRQGAVRNSIWLLRKMLWCSKSPAFGIESVNKKTIIVYEQHAHYSWQGVNFERSVSSFFSSCVRLDGEVSIKSRFSHTFVSKFGYTSCRFFVLFLIDDDIVMFVPYKISIFFSLRFTRVRCTLFLAWKYFAWSLIICDFDYSCDSNCSLRYIKIDLFVFIAFMTKR